MVTINVVIFKLKLILFLSLGRKHLLCNIKSKYVQQALDRPYSWSWNANRENHGFTMSLIFLDSSHSSDWTSTTACLRWPPATRPCCTLSTSATCRDSTTQLSTRSWRHPRTPALVIILSSLGNLRYPISLVY